MGFEKRCSLCEKHLPLSAFRVNKSRYDGRATYCDVCTLADRNERNRKTKKRCVEYKGGACEHCGGIFHPAVYDFHHINPAEKSFGIGSKCDRKWSTLQPELDKCMLLCANCHRMEHYDEQLQE